MEILACDLGSTNFKLKTFTLDNCGTVQATGNEVRIEHAQQWLNDERPLQALEEWLTSVKDRIVDNYGNRVNAMGFSTYREGLIGLSEDDRIVFAGNNLSPEPVGDIAAADRITTLAGWLCWKLTGACAITAGQRNAGESYVKQVSTFQSPRWSKIVAAGQNMQSDTKIPFNVFLDGTDEQLGYVGTGLLNPDGPELVIATGTYWSTSCIASGPVKDGVRRTNGVSPFRTVDSCVLYRWGHMIEQMDGSATRVVNEEVPGRFFGEAAVQWFSQGESVETVRKVAVRDLRAARLALTESTSIKAVVYGGGVRSPFARKLITEANDGIDLKFMESDATLRGCVIIGKGVIYAD